MDKILKTFENMQIWICVAVSILLIATLFLLFDFSPKDNYVEVKNELVMLSESIRKQYKTKPDYWGLNKSNVVDFAPKDMIINNKVVSSIGREFIVGQNELGDIVMPSQRNFMITLANLNKKSCQDIATLDIDHEKHLSLHKIILRNEDISIEFEWGQENAIPISKGNAKKYCTNKNSISWVFE